jgi:hypothetical protein
MEKHVLKEINIKLNGKSLALLDQAIINLDLNLVEVIVDDILLTPQNMALLSLASTERDKELEITGKVEDKSLLIKNVYLGTLSFGQTKGEPPHLKDILFWGSSVVWKI